MKNPQSYRISFPEVYIVEASAGSGKTYELARRYIQLLINPSEHAGEIALKNILAITFTNKAAREMKERILELLKKIALNGFVSEQEKNDIFESLGVSEALACLKSREILQIMMRSFNYFQVQTIDSFINIILSGCALDLKLSANFRIKDAYRDYLKYGFDECVDGVKNNKNILKIFEGFLKQYIYVENKNSWFAKKDILDIIEALFYDLTVYAGGFKKSEVTFSEILKQKSLTYGLIAMFFKKCPKDGLHKKFLQSLERFLAENEENFDLKELGTYFEKDELALTKGALKPAGAILKLWQQIRENLVQIAEKEAMSLFNCYIDIFELVYAEFKKFSIKDDVLFLSELNQQAKILFDSDNINVPELYYRLALRLKHYLIDEFQDTSKLQWHNLSLLINEALSGKGSLFYVGDKKQAIYRFRGGEVRLFDDLKRVYSGFDPKIVTLHKNFRSQKQIVEFNNHIFSKENLTRFINAQQPDSQNSERYFSQGDIEKITDVFKGSKQEFRPQKDKGYVKAEILECEDSDEYEGLIKERVSGLIVELKKRFALQDIAILCRSNNDVEQVTGWLIEKQINVESERTLNIKNNYLIKEFIAFLKFLNSPVDNLNFSAFILGDIFSMASNVAKEEFRAFLFEFRGRANQDKSFYFYRQFQSRYFGLWEEYFSEFYRNVGLVPLYELIISIIDKFRIFKNFENYQGFFMRFLELIKEEEEEHYGISDFLEFFEDIPESKLFISFSGENAVKLLTIHKSKGLDFRVVILPFLEMDIATMGSRAKKVKSSYIVYDSDVISGAGNDSKIGLLRLDKKYVKFSKHLKNIYHREYLRAFVDELNTLYVSFTRAKDELYLFVPNAQSKKNNIAKMFIPDEFMERGEKHNCAVFEKENTERIIPIPVPNYKRWIPFLREEFINEEHIKNRKQIEAGNFMHAILSQIHNLNDDNFKQTLDLAFGFAKNKNPYFTKINEVSKLISGLLSSYEVKPFFYIDESKDTVYREKELVNAFGHTKRIDRIIVRHDRVQVLDFKSAGTVKEEFKAQVKEYMRLISEIYPGKKVEGYILLLESQKVEKINE